MPHYQRAVWTGVRWGSLVVKAHPTNQLSPQFLPLKQETGAHLVGLLLAQCVQQLWLP